MSTQVYGRLLGESVIVSADSAGGVPVEFAEEPQGVPAGYVAKSRFVDAGTSIRQVWSVEPEVGTPAEAAVRLAEMQAASLADDEALEVAALYPEWYQGTAYYEAGRRVLYRGVLYKVLQGHAPQAGWEPDQAASLYARVLPGQSGEVGEWAQPTGAHDAYAKGDRVTHLGKEWVSTADANATEPGTVGALWEAA